MKILIVGAGGVGGILGGLLIRSGADVTFLLREKRRALILARGLEVQTPEETFTVRPQTVLAPDLKPDFDLIVLAPKAYDLDDTIDSLQGASARGVFLPFLNGMDHMSRLDERFGTERVMGGITRVAATITETGAVRQLTDMRFFAVGPRHPGQVACANQFQALCASAAVPLECSDDVEQLLWDKWVLLATLAGITTLCAAPVGPIVATPFGDKLIRQMYEQCCAVAASHGYPTGPDARQTALDLLTAPGSSFAASMLRDMERGGRTEHEHILGAMARRARDKGVRCELIEMAYTRMAVYAANTPAAA